MRFQRNKQENVMAGYVLSGKDPEGFAIKHIDKEKGRDVFAERDFKRGDFLMEYKGRLTKLDPGYGPYIFEFDYKSSRYWINASKEDGTLDKLVNDSTAGNSTTKVMEIAGIPRLGIFAVRDIRTGQEVTYSYNKGEKMNYPWIEKTGVATPPLLEEEEYDDHDLDYEPESESSDEENVKHVNLRKALVILEKFKKVSNPVKEKCTSHVLFSQSSPSSGSSPLSPQSPTPPRSPLPPASPSPPQSTPPGSPAPLRSASFAPDSAPEAREEPRRSIKKPSVNLRPQTRAKRRRWTCPVCSLEVVHLPRHLRVAH